MKHRAVCIIGAALQQEPRDTVVILFHMIPLTKTAGYGPPFRFSYAPAAKKPTGSRSSAFRSYVSVW